MMHAAVFVFFQEAGDRALLAERMQQLELSVVELNEDRVHAVIGLWLEVFRE